MELNGKLALNGAKPAVPKGLVKPWPEIRREDVEAVMKMLEGGYIRRSGPASKELEGAWADYVGSKHCIVTNSGTAALHMGVAGVGAGPGDEVITTPFSWTSTATCILHHNAIPVFADIDRYTLNISPEAIEEKITDRTKAIIPVHLYGLPCDLDKIMEIARKHDLKVIEDACQAHGATYKGKKAGTFGDVGCFSLSSNKNLPGGEGGLFVTDDEEVYRRAGRIWQFGEDRQEDGSRKYNAYGMGWMYCTTDTIAAFTLSQLKRLDWINERIRENCHYLSENLSDIKGVRVPPEFPDREHVFFIYKVLLCPEDLGIDLPPGYFRGKVESALRAEGVEIGRGEFIIPDMTLFHQKEGYGHGCPWSCHLYGRDVEYRAEDYPNAMWSVQRLTGVMGTKPPNDLVLMRRYVEAFHKVFENLDELLANSGNEVKKWKPGVLVG